MTIDMETRLQVFSEFLDCSDIALWHFDPSMNLLSSSAQEPDKMSLLMHMTGGTKVVQEYCEKNDKPGFYSDFASLVYLAVPRKINGLLTDIYVIGPVFITASSEKTLKDALSKANLPLQTARNTLLLLKSVPVVQHTLLIQYGRMLCRCIDGKIPPVTDFQPIAPNTNDRSKLLAAPSASEDNEELPSGPRVSAYALEQEIFKAVEDGNTEYTHPKEILQLTTGTLSHKGPLRSAKNEIIACITLITRAAIRGGMPEDSAYTLADYYICMLEDSESVSEVYEYSQEAFRDFTERVHKYKLASGRSKEVQACISYLELHINQKVPLKELAKAVGYNGNYLSTKFTKEIGMSISDYATNMKMERAKVYLRNTDQSLQDICADLGLSSTSYFCALFKRETGVTPMEYRNGKEGK